MGEPEKRTAMTKKRLQELVAKNLQNNPNPTIDTETGLEALQKMIVIAERHNVACALIGGIAMHLYGSPRLTKDVDVVASSLLPLKIQKRFGFGGARYSVKLGKR